nr:FAD-dependent oxidoreductase [Ancylobacter tetraedralis]
MREYVDVVIVGAGAGGISAAISAARANASVALLDTRPEVGGIVTHALIHTIAGLYDAFGGWMNEGLPVELVERVLLRDADTKKRKIGKAWVLSASPWTYRQVVEAWVAEEPGIRAFLGVNDLKVTTDGGAISSVTFRQGGSSRVLQTRALIDSSGHANAVRSIDPDLLYEDPIPALEGLIFRVRGIRSADLAFPRGLALRRAIAQAVVEGQLPQECSGAWIDMGVREDEAYIKLSVAPVRNELAPRATPDQIAEAMHRFLAKRFVAPRPAAIQAGEITRRSGARAKGEYQLTGGDVRGLARFPDAACKCAWPIEHWTSERGLELEYLEDDGYYEIPQRALRVAGVKNLAVAGMCLSSDRVAQASARVSGCCWAMGEAAGSMAVGWLK